MTLGHGAERKATTKKIHQELAPAAESKDHVHLNPQYEFYQWQVAKAQEREVLPHHQPRQ